MRYKCVGLDNVQLQLCQPGPQDSPQRRFLDAHGEGVYHLGFEVPDRDAAEAKGRARPLMRGKLLLRRLADFEDNAGAGARIEIAEAGEVLTLGLNVLARGRTFAISLIGMNGSPQAIDILPHIRFNVRQQWPPQHRSRGE